MNKFNNGDMTVTSFVINIALTHTHTQIYIFLGDVCSI